MTQCPTGQSYTQEQSNLKHIPMTTNRQTTPTTTCSPDLRQYLKHTPDTLVKGEPKRQKTPVLVMKTSTDPKILAQKASDIIDTTTTPMDAKSQEDMKSQKQTHKANTPPGPTNDFTPITPRRHKMYGIPVGRETYGILVSPDIVALRTAAGHLEHNTPGQEIIRNPTPRNGSPRNHRNLTDINTDGTLFKAGR